MISQSARPSVRCSVHGSKYYGSHYIVLAPDQMLPSSYTIVFRASSSNLLYNFLIQGKSVCHVQLFLQRCMRNGGFEKKSDEKEDVLRAP